MATLISPSYFHTEIFIPNILEATPVEQARAAELQRFINKYEPEYLDLIMGYDMRVEFLAGLAANPIPAKWSELKTQLVNTSLLLSPIADYVYFYYMRFHLTQTTRSGEITTQVDNGTLTGSNFKQVAAYNRASEQALTIREWIEERLTTYTTYNGSYCFEYLNTLGI